MDNTALWREVEMTDPAAVKPITGKSYQGNSPKPYWLIKRATEVFGPIGIGWGVNVKSERFERISDTDVLHVAIVSVWYMHEGKRAESFDQMGGTKAAYKTSKGTLMVDEDAGKKSVTDGLVKCLSMLGFAGDIFSGRWDDSKYVAHAASEWAERNLSPEEKESRKRTAELDQLINFLIESHENGQDLPAIRTWYDPATFAADNADANEERKYVWGFLPSKLRSTIKASAPEKKAA